MNFLQFLKLDEHEILHHKKEIIEGKKEIKKELKVKETTKVTKVKEIIKINKVNKVNDVNKINDVNVVNKVNDVSVVSKVNKVNVVNDVNTKVKSTNSILVNQLFKTYENKHNEYAPETILFKRGEFIRIKYLKDSDLNIYKGYNGEIKTYMKGSNEATIILEALNYPTPIVFPIEHFYKL